jgi:hypothetical protein
MMTYFLTIAWWLVSLFPATEGEILIKENFDYPDGDLPAHWWSEGCAAMIKDGRLFVDADTASYRASTIWLDRNLSGNVQIEFDAHIVSSADAANNINCFFLYSDPDGKPLTETRKQRKNGDYNSYHQFNGYIFTYLANGNPDNARFRFRYNPGFHLLTEANKYDCRIGKTYHFSIKKTGNRFQFWVDGMEILDMVDEGHKPEHQQGLFGFRTWHTAIWWDNLIIRQLD